MKIAFTAVGKDWDAIIDPRFGRTEYIVVFDAPLLVEMNLHKKLPGTMCLSIFMSNLLLL